MFNALDFILTNSEEGDQHGYDAGDDDIENADADADADDDADADADDDDDDDDPQQLDLQTKFISVSQHSAVVAQVPFELLPSSGCSFLLWKVDDLKTTRVRLG